MDGGVVALRPLPEIFDTISRPGYFLVTNGMPLTLEASEAACLGCGVSPDFRLRKGTLCGGEEMLRVALTEEHIAASEPGHRHDQALLSLLACRDFRPLQTCDPDVYLMDLSPRERPGQPVWCHGLAIRRRDARYFADRISAGGAPFLPPERSRRNEDEIIKFVTIKKLFVQLQVSFPTISIVVATFNRHASLQRLIDALERLDYPKESLEVVVVDDGSDPPVLLPSGELRVRVLRQPRGGPASARNAGIRAAAGELIALIDDDCLPHADWLQGLSQAYLAHPNALIGGRTQNGLAINRYSTASQTLVDYLYERLERTSSPNYFFTTSNIAGPRAGFVAVGFDESFVLPAGEDRDLCDRWKATGPLVYVARAVVDHCHDLSLTGFVRQQFGYGRGARALHRSRSRRGMRFCVEGLSFYGGLFAFPFRAAESQRPGSGVTTCLLFLLAQTCNAAGYLLQAAHRDSKCRLTDRP